MHIDLDLTSAIRYVNAELTDKGLDPLTLEQQACLRDVARRAEALGMLDDLQARCGLSATACAEVLGQLAPAYAVRYVYAHPSPAGPFRGRTVTGDKCAKGDFIYGTFGAATVVSCRLVK